ncbi:hypothetical protein Csa_008282 [Cucumis sativus]|uniref:Uncharacterized protein n=1 Tax=Cucumis sativus TaxID=3659 RepID=A0A0A0KTM9_CUCSA|nr:hypothetical protein Csa_008282 [Cucumis sativus]
MGKNIGKKGKAFYTVADMILLHQSYCAYTSLLFSALPFFTLPPITLFVGPQLSTHAGLRTTGSLA